MSADLARHRSVSLDVLRSTAGFAVRTPRGQKDPGVVKWDPKTNSREKSDQIIHVLETTDDNLGIHLFGSVVDVDVDTDNPFIQPALDHFLPMTTHVWGRPSRPRTHRLYELSSGAQFDPSAFPFLSKLQANPAVAIEVRGGEQKSGRYSLLPGSVHPSGEPYEWHNVDAAQTTPAQVPLSKLMDGVKLACVAALIAPYWVEGVRNELCKALCGFMFRASQFSEDLEEEFPFDKDSARRLLEGILLIAGDDESDRFMRIRTFDQTWEKGVEGAPIVGATTLAKLIGEDILPLLYALLANTPDVQRLDAMFAQFALIRNTTTIIDFDAIGKGTYTVNRDAFDLAFQNKLIDTPKGKVSMARVFLASRHRPEVDRMGMDPAQPKIFDEDGRRCANIWTGWAIPPADDPVTDEEVAPILDYLHRVICRADKPLFEWVLQWLADIFQNPSTKPGTALILVGEQGAGKTFLPERILRPIIGNMHFTKVSGTERLTAKFNSEMAGKLLIQGEEVLNSNRKVDADLMKDMITSRTRTIEFKGKDVVEMEDFARYILTSNNIDNAVHVGKGDRRSTIVHVSDEYAAVNGGNTITDHSRAYFSNLFAWVEESDGVPHKENLAKLHRYLLDVPISRGTIRVAHMTDAKRATRLNSTRGIDAWLLSMIEQDGPFDNLRENDRGENYAFKRGPKNHWESTNGWPEVVKYAVAEASLRKYTARDYGEQRTAQQIIKHFKDHGILKDSDLIRFRFGGTSHKVRPWPTLGAVRNYLIANGYTVLDGMEDAPDTPDGKPEY